MANLYSFLYSRRLKDADEVGIATQQPILPTFANSAQQPLVAGQSVQLQVIGPAGGNAETRQNRILSVVFYSYSKCNICIKVRTQKFALLKVQYMKVTILCVIVVCKAPLVDVYHSSKISDPI